MEIKNLKIAFLEESIIKSGYPMQIGCPDSLYDDEPWSETQSELLIDIYGTEAGHKHLNRAKKLAKSPVGSGHDNFLKGIIVQFDLKYPQYFTPQLQRYHWIDVISSQSKMHSLVKIKDISSYCNKYVFEECVIRVNDLIYVYNVGIFPTEYQTDSKLSKFSIDSKEECFQYIISNLPMGFELWMGISTNYLQLKTIYNQRRTHKLKDDWGYFCNWIETLPMSELITSKS